MLHIVMHKIFDVYLMLMLFFLLYLQTEGSPKAVKLK